jgi:mannose-6-phosphate isomerase-like protein (cupin superfamily)
MTRLVGSAPLAPERTILLGRELRATILATAAETGGRFDFTDTFQSPDATTPLHLHRRYTERFWVVSGSMTVWAGPETVTLRSGDYLYVPTEVPHAVRAGSEGCRALHISSPAGFAELLARAGAPAHRAGAEDQFDPERFLAIATELGDVVLGPPGAVPADLGATGPD